MSYFDWIIKRFNISVLLLQIAHPTLTLFLSQNEETEKEEPENEQTREPENQPTKTQTTRHKYN